MSATIQRVEWDTAACRYAQEDGSDTYVVLVIYCTINGEHRRLRLSTSEALYPGNAAMIELLQQLTTKEELQ